MRSTVILAISILVLLAIFALYFAMQPTVAPPTPTMARATQNSAQPLSSLPPPTTQGGTVAGPGDDVWVKTYDEKTGRLAFQLRAARYDPQPDGNSVKVSRPQAEIFLGDETTGDARILRIEGSEGEVVMPSDAAKRGQFRSSQGTPRSGTLHNVVITLLDTADTARPLLTCRVNNVAFDNDAYRISTEMFTDTSGTTIPADEVPVEIRGDEYDFDGRGLTIKWDGIDRRLSLLEIAHGEKLVVKSPAATDLLSGTSTQSAARDHRDDRAQLAAQTRAARPKDASQRATHDSPKASKRSAFVYRAAFASEVKVSQDDQPLALADEMFVEFPSNSEGSAQSSPSTRPTTKRSVARAGSSASGAPATTRPASPIVVRWVGKLRVTPRAMGDAPAPLAGKFDIALRGYTQPVMINFRGSQVSCASIEHHSAGDRVTFSGAPGIPMVVMRDANGAVLRTPQFAYFGDEGKAISTGASAGEFPVQTDAAQPPQLAHIEWGESCEIKLEGESRNALTIQTAELRGGVTLEHPQLVLDAHRLKVAFDRDDQADHANATLRAVDASGAVHATMIDEQKKTQAITCDELALTTARAPHGKTIVRTMTAEGKVHAFDDEQEIHAGRITMTLQPAPETLEAEPRDAAAGGFAFGAAGGDVLLDTLLAQENVRINSTNGSAAKGDELRITGDGEDQRVVLLGQPNASVSDGANTVVGQSISMQPRRGEMNVAGPGTLQGVQKASADAPARTIDVEWSRGLTADGARNLIEVSGDVRAASRETGGAEQLATAEKLIIALADEPHEGQAAAGRTQEDLNPMRGKVFRAMTLDGNAVLQMSEVAEDGAGQRDAHLFAQTATYDAIDRTFQVPGAGRLLLRDDSATPTTIPTGPDDPQLRGATAFEWKAGLVFDESKNRATMTGDVVIVHQELGPDPNPFRLEAAEVAADLISADTTGDSALRQQGRVGPGAADFRIKRLIASDGVRFTSRQIRFEASTLEFDPATSTLIARGSDRIPAQVYDDQGLSTGSFDELWFNTKTEHFGLKKPHAQIRR